jgi:hypothetical protein
MKIVSLKVADALDQRLTAAARTRQTTRSDLLRTAIEAFLDEGRGSRPSSCLDLAADVIGTVEGPSDLSVARRHMKGFGQ